MTIRTDWLRFQTERTRKVQMVNTQQAGRCTQRIENG